MTIFVPFNLQESTSMKKFIAYFKGFHAGYFNARLYSTILLFIAILITFNYTLDVEHLYIKSFSSAPIRILLFFIYHAIAFYGVLFIIYLFDKKRIEFTRSFWIKSLLGFAVLAIDRGTPQLFATFLSKGCPGETMLFCFKVLINSSSWLSIFGLLLIMKLIFDRKDDNGLYGLRFSQVNFKAYFILLLIMVPLVYGASFIPEFIDYYPVYKRTGGLGFANFYKLPEYVSKITFEFFYITDFLNTEVFFRGFLIIGLSKLIGKNAVLAMAATYCVLHFGKPMGETISSVFGGYILGILALYSRNIWGGVFVHGGTALLMEIFAFGKM